jgi:pimeloyl-ACP methyl ester carboxylesterase
MWEPQLSLAALGWRVIVPELRGFGDGAGDPPTTSIDDYAADVIDLLDALHIQDATICGLSMGGYTAFAMFRLAPRYFQAMILADTKAPGDSPEAVTGRKNMQQLVRERGQSAVAEVLLPKLVGDTTRRDRPDVIEQLRRQITGNSVESIAGALTAMMTRPDSTPTLASIHCPVQILVGDEDALTPPPLSEQMHRDIAGSDLVVIEGAGHMSNMEQPQRFNDALAHFLEHRV